MANTRLLPDISNFRDYREYLSAFIRSRPMEGHGTLSEFAKVLEVNRSYVSNVMKGSHSFSRQQSFILAKHLHLSDLETEYFMELVDLERCTSSKFRIRIQEKLAQLKRKLRSKSGYSPSDQALDDYSKSIFYSNWSYAGIHLLMGLKPYRTPASIAKRLNLDQTEVKQVLKFLVECGMSETDGVTFFPSIKSTHLEHSSPFRIRHHLNWRMKAVDSISSSKPDDIYFTAPMRLSLAARVELASQIKNLIAETKSALEGKHATGEEELLCMNIDFFGF